MTEVYNIRGEKFIVGELVRYYGDGSYAVIIDFGDVYNVLLRYDGKKDVFWASLHDIEKRKRMNKSSFAWTDELVKEMIYQKLPVPDHYISNVQKCLDEFKESKQQPLFTTEDSVKIWDGDFCPIHAVCTGNFVMCSFRAKDCLPLKDNWKYFAHKEKAEYYIKVNKPLNISMKELGECITHYSRPAYFVNDKPQSQTVIDIEKLEELIKQKG